LNQIRRKYHKTLWFDDMFLQAEVSSESETPALAADSPQTEVSQNVSFIDNAAGLSVSAAPATNHVAKVDNTDDLQLGQFLSRPTLINTTTWSTADVTGVKTTLQPWYLFLNSAAIKKKLDNFAYLRGRLHIKVVLNGTPFQFGAVRACYSPLLGTVSDKIRTNPITALSLLIPYSQQPGFFMYPQANAGGEMVLPFFYHKNWLDITVAADVQNFGTLNYLIYSILRTAVAGGTTDVTLQTFAWMTDVELMGSTSRLALQADEYVEGKISKPATAVASVASTLTMVPYIGPFARATAIGATALAGIARLFGYTNVPVIADIHGFQPMNAPMLASGHIGTPVQKLTLDPKQELSIDPSPHGLESQDELALSYLKKKESYFGRVNWDTSDAADALKFVLRVNPYQPECIPLYNTLTVEVGKRVYHTPLSYTGAMFKHWRGGLILRIKIVATKFHKGRLKIQYDPRNDISAVSPAENTVYTTILDIGESDDLEIEIPFHQPQAWLLNDQTLDQNWSGGGALANRLGTDNGLLTIRVLTALTAPAAGAINLLFFLRGADDFEYANPNDHIGPDDNNKVPSFFALQADDHTEIVATRICVGNKATVSTERYGLNYGENICSLRALLHRSHLLDTSWVPVMNTGSIVNVMKILKIMPYVPGYNSDVLWPHNAAKVIAAAGSSQYAFNTMGHLPYVAGMFLGYRGGVNYTLTPGNDDYSSIADMRAIRWTTPTTDSAYRYWKVWTFASLASVVSIRANFLNRLSYLGDGLGGMAITSTATNSSLSVQIPDYKPYNFSLADPVNYNYGSTKDGTDIQSVAVQTLISTPTTRSISYITLQTEVAAAPDFTCLFFLCCPTMDYQLNNPTPV
jgi:hypothetical protein